MKHLKLAYQLFVITIVMYLLRPLEAIVCATISGCKSFYETFKDKMWVDLGYTAKELYKTLLMFGKNQNNVHS